MGAIQKKLNESEMHIDTASTLSTLIEKVVLGLLPDEQKFNKSEDEVIEAHVSKIIGDHADLQYMRQELDNDSIHLTWKHPRYLEIKAAKGGYVDHEQRIWITEMVKKQTLVTIITEAGYRPALTALLGNRPT